MLGKKPLYAPHALKENACTADTSNMKDTHGWQGRILHIDLSTGKYQVLEPEPALYRRFLGGKGLAGAFLRPLFHLAWDDPESPLCIFAGPLTATLAPTSGRCSVMARSPLTGAVGDSSVGGRLGTELKRAGWDGIIVTGKSPKLCGVHIDDRKVRIRDAEHLAGAGAKEVLQSCGKGRSVMSAGPAAENGVRFASLSVDRHHSAGRCGLGLFAANKNLKYLTIKGTSRVKVADLPALKTAREDIFRLTAASPVLLGQNGFSCFGTGALFDLMHSRRMMPTDNFRRTRFDAAPHLGAVAFKERYHPHKYGCKGCHILCKKVTADGVSMPEFETMSHFTALLGNEDIELVTRANALCGEQGMDTISAASTLACHSEYTGVRLAPQHILDLLRDTALGLGLGRELGQGSQRYAASLSRPDLSMSVKSLELPAYDPRGAYGLALGYCVSTRGGCHLRSYPISHEILRKPVSTDRFSFSGKARIIKISEDVNAAVDCLTACKFIFLAAGLEEFSKALSAVTREPWSTQELLRVGERVDYQERLMNASVGFSAADDDLPTRFFQESGTGGDGLEIPPLERSAFIDARARYYRIRGLDQNGRPTMERAAQLDLASPLGDVS